jgi:two-component system CheB/CheR fusion protein
VLLFELQHRVKNIVATISALATRMLKNTTSLQSFSTDFLGRLRAMAATHELLSRQNWTGASLQELIATAIGSHLPSRSPQIRLTGPDLTLSPNAAATLGMVFYELATNAIKYGSLSVGKGRVDISWVVDTGQEGAQVGLRWFESDGPIVSAPDNKGFGAGFVSRSVAYELQGEANMQFHETGFQCDLRFPLRRNVQTRHVSGMEDAKNAEHPK